MAEAFTGKSGKYVKVEDTIEGFKRLVAGEFDHIAERHFYMTGTIDEVLENHERDK